MTKVLVDKALEHCRAVETLPVCAAYITTLGITEIEKHLSRWVD